MCWSKTKWSLFRGLVPYIKQATSAAFDMAWWTCCSAFCLPTNPAAHLVPTFHICFLTVSEHIWCNDAQFHHIKPEMLSDTFSAPHSRTLALQVSLTMPALWPFATLLKAIIIRGVPIVVGFGLGFLAWPCSVSWSSFSFVEKLLDLEALLNARFSMAACYHYAHINWLPTWKLNQLFYDHTFLKMNSRLWALLWWLESAHACESCMKMLWTFSNNTAMVFWSIMCLSHGHCKFKIGLCCAQSPCTLLKMMDLSKLWPPLPRAYACTCASKMRQNPTWFSLKAKWYHRIRIYGGASRGLHFAQQHRARIFDHCDNLIETGCKMWKRHYILKSHVVSRTCIASRDHPLCNATWPPISDLAMCFASPRTQNQSNANG